jgi:hypothetical protein
MIGYDESSEGFGAFIVLIIAKAEQFFVPTRFNKKG